MADLQRLEADIQRLVDVLESPGGGGLTEPLVDNEGFPRSDIDVYATRQHRNQLAQLRTDWKLARKEMEETLYKIHAK